MIESSTENQKNCHDFLNQLKERGLKSDEKILFVIDESKGLRKGIEIVFGNQTIIQRCQCHKRENVVAYLPKGEQSRFRKKLQKSYQEKNTTKQRRNCVRF